jgi:hypothetical protein
MRGMIHWWPAGWDYRQAASAILHPDRSVSLYFDGARFNTGTESQYRWHYRAAWTPSTGSLLFGSVPAENWDDYGPSIVRFGGRWLCAYTFASLKAGAPQPRERVGLASAPEIGGPWSIVTHDWIIPTPTRPGGGCWLVGIVVSSEELVILTWDWQSIVNDEWGNARMDVPIHQLYRCGPDLVPVHVGRISTPGATRLTCWTDCAIAGTGRMVTLGTDTNRSAHDPVVREWESLTPVADWGGSPPTFIPTGREWRSTWAPYVWHPGYLRHEDGRRAEPGMVLFESGHNADPMAPWGAPIEWVAEESLRLPPSWGHDPAEVWGV